MAGPIRLLHLTDTHLLGDRHARLRGVESFAMLQAVRAQAASQFEDIDGTLLTGDLVHDDAQGYALVREAFKDSPTPVYCIPGNHDIPDAMYHTLSDAPFNVAQVNTIGNWVIVLINTWLANTADGEIGDDQLSEIDELLSEHSQQHALLCLHHHPIPMGSAWLDRVGLRDALDFTTCIAKHSNVRGVLWGHVHQALDTVIDKVHYMSTPSTCAQFQPNSAHFAVDNKPPGYRTLELLPDGKIITQVNWLETVALRSAGQSI
jgi:Icc protein